MKHGCDGDTSTVDANLRIIADVFRGMRSYLMKRTPRKPKQEPPTGFFWHERGLYRVVILWHTKRHHLPRTRTLQAPTARELVADAKHVGWNIGKPPEVKRMCEQAPCSV